MDSKDPLAPLETAVSVIVWLMLGFAAIMVIAFTFGSGSVAGMSRHDSQVCVEIQPGQGVPYVSTGDESGKVKGLRSGVTSNPSEIQVCDTKPGAAEIALQALTVVPALAGVVGFFVWLRFLLRRMRRDGVFADRVPHAFGMLGGALVIWAMLVWPIDGFVRAALLNRMTEDSTAIFLSANFPIVPILVGVGLMTLGRVFGQAVALRHDSEATI